jgi:hypothetical protein
MEAAMTVSDDRGTAAKDSQNTIVFVHVPKSAGTAFANYLKENCGDPDRALLAFYGDYSMYKGLKDVPVVAAHAHYREMSQVFPGASFVTWLRHPIARAISQYKSWHNPDNLHAHWLENMPKESFEHVYFAQKATFEEFVFSDHPEIVANLRNVYGGMIGSEFMKSHRVLASAKENLVRRFRFFGLVERFDESMDLFRDSFGWSAEFKDEAEHANRSKQEVRPSVKAIERLLEMNQIDMPLYEFACLLFEDRLRRLRTGRSLRAA